MCNQFKDRLWKNKACPLCDLARNEEHWHYDCFCMCSNAMQILFKHAQEFLEDPMAGQGNLNPWVYRLLTGMTREDYFATKRRNQQGAAVRATKHLIVMNCIKAIPYRSN